MKEKNTVSLFYKNGIKVAGSSHRTLVSVLTGATSHKDVTGQLSKIEAIDSLPISQRPDIISDLSIENSNSELFKDIIKNFPDYIVSTLPIYKCPTRDGFIEEHELLDIVQDHIESGVGFVTIHPTANNKLVQLAQSRLTPWTSRGGVMVIKDLASRNYKTENIYLRILDEVIRLAKKSHTAISLGATFRSANIFDSVDECQLQEFKLQAEIANYIKARGVHVIIEGPGHSSPNQLKRVATYYNEMGFPIMPLGPIPTDIAINEDHIASAIGATILGMLDCADIVTAVTREEHTGKIPSTNSSIEAIKAAKIAAHVIDLYKLDDHTADWEVVLERSSNQTCIYGKKNSGCSRCSHTCPLEYIS